MKHSRLVLTALAVLAIGSWATLASACDAKAKVKTAAVSSKSSACTAEMAALCTPEMAAACKAKGMTAAGMEGCSHAAKTAMAAASGCSYHAQGSAVSAVASGGCGAKGKTVSATTAANHGVARASTVDAVLAGAGGSCSGHGAAKTADQWKHADCDACADMAFCDGEVRALGATVQVVPLKNGVMYVYTAGAPGKVHAVQASMGRRNERMVTMLASSDKAKLCPSCKSVRGAIASGKLNRELVNIEGGCLTLMTSDDPATVSKIYTLAGLKGPVSVKS